MFGSENQSQSDFKKGLNKVYTWYTGGFVAFVIVVAILEQMGLPRNWISVPGGDGAPLRRYWCDESYQ
jgi:cation/acetate symporter